MPCGLVQALRHSAIARRNPPADKPRLRDASSASRRPGSVEREEAGGGNTSSGKAPLQNEELSEYECARQAAILENQAVLIELGLMHAPS